jgi:EH_Signature domain
MGALDRLRAALRQGPDPVVRALPLLELERQEKVLTQRIVQGRTSDTPPVDAIIEAVELFVKTKRFRNSRDAKLVAFGCAEPIGRAHYRLVEDAERFPLVLKGAESFRHYRPAFRGCYRGLLETYLGYHPDEKDTPAGRLNWTNLRSWLQANLRDTQEPGGVDAGWVTEVVSNPALFSENPVQEFGREMLDDADASFLRFRRALGIKETSWLIAQLVLQQVHIAGKSDGPGLTAYLPKLLTLLESLTRNNAHIFNQALGLMLTYYQGRKPVVLHTELRDFAVKHWGNPWLHGGIDEWGLVDDDVRQMVGSWLKLHCIQQFFGVLAQEGDSDPRRLKFWEQYHDAVDRVTFALGPHARTSQDEDMANVREMMEGLMVDLQGGGTRRNNAFIMQFGDWVLVEFGVTGNACFFFKSSNLPFDLSDGFVSAPAIRSHIDGYGNSAHDPIRRTHRDRSEGDWEYIFAREMGKRGIFPERKVRDTQPRWSAQVKTDTRVQQVETCTRLPDGLPPHDSRVAAGDHPVEGRNADASSSATKTSRTEDSTSVVQFPFGAKQEKELFALCRRMKVDVRDMRTRQGNLWVVLDKPVDNSLTPLLRSYGFRYRPGRGWWYMGEAGNLDGM